MFWPHWENEPNVSVRHIPGGNTDDVQFGGRGYGKLTVKCYVTSDADVSTLQSSVDGTGRTLGSYNGSDYTNSYLTKISDLRRWDSGQKWTCTLEFLRQA